MTGLLIAALLALAPQESLSGSADARVEADFRCFAASLVMAGLADEENDQEAIDAAALVSFYYLGRLEGRDGSVDWVARGIDAGNAQPDRLLPELSRCGAEFGAKGQEILDKAEPGGS